MGKPKIRFRGFNDDWEQRKLGDIVDVCSGRDYKHLEEGNIPVYGTGGYMLSVNEALSDDEDAIGIGRKGTIDNPYILRAPFWTVDTLFYAVPRKNYDLEFVFSIFQNINWKAKDESTGVPSLSKTTINAVKTMISDYDEQKKIGQYFSELDRLITLHQRKCEETNKIKKYMLQNMFPQDGEKTPKIRFEGFTDDWEQRKLRSVAHKTYGGGTPKTSEEEFWNGTIPWFQSADLIEHEVQSTVAKKAITELGLQKSAAQLIPGNSIAIVTRVGVGKLTFMAFPYATSQDFLSLSELNIDERFGCYAIYRLLQREKNFTQGTSIKGITKDELLNKIIDIPNREEQQKIGRYFTALDHLITLHQRKRDELQNLKKFMLQNMFV